MFWLGFADQSDAPPPVDPNEPLLEEEEDHGDDEVADLILKLMPWGISFLLHAGLILLAVFIVWSVKVQVEEDQVIIPDARLSATPGTPIRVTSKTQTKTTSSSRRSVTRSQSQSQSISKSTVKTETSLIGAVGASAGEASPFGEAVTSGNEFASTMYGTGGNAVKIIYLIDASGSLIDSLPFVIDELKRSINALSAKQRFTVIFFKGGDVIEVPPRGLQAATEDNKRKVIQWVDLNSGNIVPGGLTDPVAALERALLYSPQLLYILSDNITGTGIYEVDQRSLLKRMKQANKAKTIINAIQFLYPDPLVAAGLPGTMELIAEQTGGQYKYLDAAELNIQ